MKDLFINFNYNNIAVVEKTTNNIAEIQAVTIAAKQAKKAGIKNLKINIDSQFLISCINNWMAKWKCNGWKTFNNKPVINKIELLEMKNILKSLNVIWVIYNYFINILYCISILYTNILIFQNHVNDHAGIYSNDNY